MDSSASGSWHPSITFGDRLRVIRRDMNLSQEEFAARLAVKRVTLSAWESGRNHPDDLVSMAKRVQMATRVPASWLLGLDDSLGGDDGLACAIRDSNPEPAG